MVEDMDIMVENEKDGIEVNMGRREHRNNETAKCRREGWSRPSKGAGKCNVNPKNLRSKDVMGSSCILDRGSRGEHWREDNLV